MANATRKRKRSRPADGRAPIRYFRMEDEEWVIAQRGARRRRQTMSAFIRDVLLNPTYRTAKEPHERKRDRRAAGRAPQRVFRMEDDQWKIAGRNAKTRKQTMSAFIRDAILNAAKKRPKAK
jgi:hypothetical protein